MVSWKFVTLPLVLLGVLFVTTCLSLTSRQRREVLKAHNSIRRSMTRQYRISNMNQLVWSKALEHTAKRKNVCTLVRQKSWRVQHNVGRSRTGNVTSQIMKWFSQSRLYLHEHQLCFPTNKCNRFKQIVTANQVSVGCSITSCGFRHRPHVLFCLYEGGSEETFGFKTGNSCTHCESPRSFCNTNLCVLCNQDSNSCDCRKTCNSPGIGGGRLNSTTCTCKCDSGLGPNCDMECKNPELYEDYDYCSTLNTEDCEDPSMKDILAEYCPEQCVCNG